MKTTTTIGLLCLLLSLPWSAQATTLADLVTGDGTLTTSGGLTFSHFRADLETRALTDDGTTPVVTIHTTSVSTLATLTAEPLGPDSIAFRGFQWTGTIEPLTQTMLHQNTDYAQMSLGVSYDVTGLGVDTRFPYGPRVSVSAAADLQADRWAHYANVTPPSGETVDLHIFNNAHPWNVSETLPVGTTRVFVQESIGLNPLSRCFPPSNGGIAGGPVHPASCDALQLGVNPSAYPGPAVGAVFMTFETAPIHAVPEPGTGVLVVTGLLGFFTLRRWSYA